MELLPRDLHDAYKHTGGIAETAANSVKHAIGPSVMAARNEADSYGDVVGAVAKDTVLFVDPGFGSVAGASSAATDAVLSASARRESQLAVDRQQFHYNRARSMRITIPEYRAKGYFNSSDVPLKYRE